MLGWIKKKADDKPVAKTPQTPPPVPATGNTPKDSPELIAQWQTRLDTAKGDDAALLEVARQAPIVALKCGAVEAIAGEAALKQAEREFRDHDRRVHRIAKQRHDAAVAQRVAREKAAGLLDAATALLAEPTIPTNRLVEIDKSWQALGPALLDDAQRARFAELSARLTELTTERAERELQAQRWTAAANQALTRLGRALAQAATPATATATAPAPATVPGAAAAGPTAAAEPAGLDATPDELTLAIARAQACSADAPPGTATEALAARLNEAVAQALERAAQAEARREAQRLLPPEPPSPPAPPADAPARESREAREARAARQQERVKAVTPLLQQAEEALAAGNLAGAHRHLTQLDTALAGANLPEALRARLNAVHAEVARLKGWQSWGGGRARDDLVQEAQTLATATTAALADPQQAAKLPVKQLADAIDDLRKRWKELDRLGGATNQTLWHAFDAALKTCFEPVGAHLDQLKARRKENLSARQQLIDALDAVPVVEAVEAAAQDVDWREAARALGHFQTEWRKLGPVEHTVPHKSRDALLARMQASLARIEGPLQQARQSAQQTREQLVARAAALRDEAAANPHGRDIVGRVRELQEQWQQHARSLPLARQAENALWAEFKAATDAVFAQRDAAFNARDAELLANQAGREALIARLEALTDQTPAADLKRTLAEVDAQWRQPVDVPRQQVAPLDTRFRQARQAAQQLLAGSAQRLRHARFDALLDKLALCEQREALAAGAEATTSEDLAARWAAAAPLQPAWEQPLAARWQEAGAAPGTTAANGAGTLDSVLLQLEAALDIASPADAQAARRDLKLRAMKAALEGRGATQAPPGVEALAQTALRHAHLSTPQRERLQAAIAALRTRETSPP